ncbi:energy transducer TonB [Comamonas granuli]|uniref:energy transducer TonB n=1 Tax=Comamonas granuli TaxID=290309 RepID=UPI000A04A005|nr:energy transducer TonB [Comamonas granuli]
MSAPTLTMSAPARMAARDWGPSLLLHAGLLGLALWWGLEQAPAVERLEVAVRWAAPPAPAPQPPQVAPAPPAPQPAPAPRPRAVAAPRPTPVPQVPVQAPQPQAEPLRSESTVATPVAAAAAAEAPRAVAAVAPPAPPSAAAPPAPQDDQSYQQWRARLEQALQQGKRYPASARRMGQSGTVVVHLRVGADGSLQHCTLHHSSGFKALDHAAEQLVRSVAQALAAQMAPGRAADLRIPIVYELTES